MSAATSPESIHWDFMQRGAFGTQARSVIQGFHTQPGARNILQRAARPSREEVSP
jgi:hypothetical protein